MLVSDRFVHENFFGLRLNVVRALRRLGLWRKVSNYLLAEIELKLGRKRVWSKPYWFTFDPNSGCDLHCPLCPTGRGKGTRVRTQLRWEHFTHTMDELGPTLLHVEFSNWGEPLLNPLIYDMVRYTKQFGVEVHLSSHFNHFSEEAANRIIDCGLDWMILSIDGATPETYARYRVGGDFNKVMRNLKTLVEVKRRRNSPKPYLIWQFLVFRHNEHEIDRVKALGKEMGVDIVGISPAAIGIPEMLPQGPGKYLYPELGKAAVQEMTNAEDYYGNQKKGLPLCVWPWLGSVVNANGSVSPCCGIEDEEKDYGNAFERGFFDIWRGRDYSEGRRFVVSREDNGYKNTCTQCTYIGKNNFHIPASWGTGWMGKTPIVEIFRPLPAGDWKFPARDEPFRPGRLLNPFYLARRAREINSTDELLRKSGDLCRYALGRLEALWYAAYGRIHSAYPTAERCYYEVRGWLIWGNARVEHYYYVVRGFLMPEVLLWRTKNIFLFLYQRLDEAEQRVRERRARRR